MNTIAGWRQRPRSQKIIIFLLALYLLYGLLGYFAGSPLLRSSIENGLADATGREVQLERVVFNPLGLTLTLENFAFLDPDGTEFIAFDRLYTDFELSSLVRLSWHFDVLELDRPRINISQNGPRSFNFDDLLARARNDAGKASETGDDDSPASMAALSIGQLLLSAGDFRFRDTTGAEPQELVLDDLNFEILDFSTRSDGADGNNYSLAITSPEGGSFAWTGSMSVEPLVLNGHLELAGLELPPFAEFYRDRLRFDMPDGQLDIATSYVVDLSGEEAVVTLADGSVLLRDFRVLQNGLEQDTLAVPQMRVDGVALSSSDKTVQIDSVTVTEPDLLMRQTTDGLDLAHLFAPSETADGQQSEAQVEAVAEDQSAQDPAPQAPAAQAKEPASVPADAAADVATSTPASGDGQGTGEPSPWSLALARLDLQQASVAYREETLGEPAEILLAPMNLVVENLHWGADGDFTFSGDAVLSEQGLLTYSGSGNLAPLQMDVKLGATDVSLLAVEPWLRDSARLDLTSGLVSADLSATVKEQADTLAVTVGGQFAGREIRITELDGQPLLDLQAFNLADITVDVTGRELAVRRTDISGLNLEALIDEQGRTVGGRVAVPVTAPVEPDTADKGPDWHIRLGEVRLSDSAVALTDRSMSPDFSFGLYALNGRLENVDTAKDGPSRLTLSADVDRYAPLRIEGDLRLSADNPYSDLVIALENYEMTSLTPYTGLYVGHAVSSGQLALTTNMTLDGTVLDSSTDFRAHNFYLGEKMESDQAIKAPVKLGLAVLRNSEGLIRLPVNASGDLSDPSVSVRGIIFQAIGNVLVKAATSPFSILASLAGAENLDMVPFPAGDAELSDDGRRRLNALIKVLTERPALQMELAGAWTRADSEALAREDRIVALWGDDWESLDVAVQSWNFRRKVRNAYQELTGNDPYQLARLADDADGDSRDAHERTVARLAFEALVQQGADNLAPDRLDQLAAARAKAAKAWLVNAGGIDAGRLFLQSQALAGHKPVSGVQIGLSAR